MRTGKRGDRRRPTEGRAAEVTGAAPGAAQVNTGTREPGRAPSRRQPAPLPTQAPVPRLHAIAADDVLDRPDFVEVASALLRAGGGDLAVHLRAHGRAAGALFALAQRLAPAAAGSGAWLVLNDRVDVALALASAPRGAAAPAGPLALGVQLGARSLPLAAVRAVVGRALSLGYSAHAAEEAGAMAAAGADWVLLGTIYATASHPGRPGAGPELVAEAATRLDATAGGPRPPLVAIGGVRPEHVRELCAAGAHGVAVLRGLWLARDALAALAEYRAALDEPRG